MKNLIILLAIFSLISCSYRPILDQNAKYHEVGEEQAQRDIKECKTAADDYLDRLKAERVAKQAARTAVVGSVVGTVIGIIGGGTIRSSLVGAAIGAGAGAGIGGLSAAGEGHVSPDQLKQRYISNCLAGKGYSVIGWV